MGKYKIQMTYPKDGHKGYVEVKGYPVSIPWLKGIKLFAHHPYSGEISYWNISEVRTGLSFVEYCRGTKKQAIDALKAKLASIQTDNISQLIRGRVDKYVAEFGIANVEPEV